MCEQSGNDYQREGKKPEEEVVRNLSRVVERRLPKLNKQSLRASYVRPKMKAKIIPH